MPEHSQENMFWAPSGILAIFGRIWQRAAGSHRLLLNGLPRFLRHPFQTVRHRISVANPQRIEAELLREVQHKAAAFENAYNCCSKRRMGTLQECLEGFARLAI